MPQVKPAKSTSKWKLVVIPLASVVLIVAAVAGVMYWQWLSQAGARYDKAKSQADTYLRLEQFDDAAHVYEAYLKTHPSNDYAYRTDIRLAQLYDQKGDSTAALAWYQKAEKMGTSLDLVVKPGIAMDAQALGQKELSIKYYNESIALLRKTDSPSKEQTISEYRAGIESQGGKVD